MLGDPTYILFLVDVERKLLAIRQGNVDDPLSQKIYWDSINNRRQCCEFYSKLLIEGLEEWLLKTSGEKTLRSVGRYYGKSRSVIFDLSEARPVGEESLK